MFSSDGARLKGVDESNALVLPANKAKKKKVSVTTFSTKKPLTKKQKKELEKVLERKEKKAQVRRQSDVAASDKTVQLSEERYFPKGISLTGFYKQIF